MPHRFAGLTVRDILKRKKASILTAPFPDGSPAWSQIMSPTWEELDLAATGGLPGYRTIRKLLSDSRFDR